MNREYLLKDIREYVLSHYDSCVDTTDSSCCPSMPESVSAYIEETEETWQEMLVRILNEKELSNTDCYRKAGLDRKHFSKILGNRDYRPRRKTAIVIAMALGLSMQETKEMLEKAGFALSHADRTDLAVEYFILHKNYDVMLLNEILTDLGEKPL